MPENYAEIHARPGEAVGAFFARCVEIAKVIDGTVFGTHNGTTIDVGPTTLPTLAARNWERARTHVDAGA